MAKIGGSLEGVRETGFKLARALDQQPVRRLLAVKTVPDEIEGDYDLGSRI
jgi:hypothetical protein